MIKRIWIGLYLLSSGKTFCRFVAAVLPWLVGIAAIAFCYGLVGGLLLAPADYQQGDAFRIIYIHVPSAFLSLMCYSAMAFCSILFLVWRIKMADVMLEVLPPIGASFTLLALISGSIWGKPMWGTWWIWDARLTSELILLFLYAGVILLRKAIPEPKQSAAAVSVLALIGFIDIPLIHYSVYWWNTLHQGATLTLLSKPKIAPSMLKPLLAMIVAFIVYCLALTLYRARTVLLYRERQTQWVKKHLQII